MSFFIIHAPACTPDAGLFELPMHDDRPVGDMHEVETLLHYEEEVEECNRCCRKKRRVSFDAYPEKPSASFLARQPRPQPRGCKRLIAAIRHFVCLCCSRRRYRLVTRYRYYKQKKPYSAISVHVEQLTSETYEEDDLSGVPELLESVKLQASGPSEAARAIRKKLKYGSVHRQLRALTILDGLMQNGGSRLQRNILADGPLMERLRIAAADPISDQDVRAKCKVLFSQWVASSKDNPGFEGAKSLYNQLPKTQKPVQQRRDQSKVLRETEEDVQRETELEQARSRSSSLINTPSAESSTSPRKQSTPITLSQASTFGTKLSKKDKKNKNSKQTFNLEREKPAILQSIASSSVASTNLNNALKLVNRETSRVSNDAEVMRRFETCKQLRRQILRYIQYVETDEFLGGLIHANEELVSALMAFEVLDKSVDDDSDSELEEAQHLSRQAAKSEQSAARDAEKMVAGLSVSPPSKPPRPGSGMTVPMPAPGRPPVKSKPTEWRRKQVEEDSESDTDVDDDSDDPFGDKNAMKTPDPERGLGKGVERRGYGFKEV
jgi:LAS seventeen-binding protein 5